jgi:hypothetical protein
MKFRAVAVVLLAAATAFAAPPPKPKIVAPDVFPHPTAMLLNSLSNGGKSRVSFRAAAVGTRFFFEEPAGVSVYVYDGLNYRREAFLKKTTLEKAMKAYKKLR